MLCKTVIQRTEEKKEKKHIPTRGHTPHGPTPPPQTQTQTTKTREKTKEPKKQSKQMLTGVSALIDPSASHPKRCIMGLPDSKNSKVLSLEHLLIKQCTKL